MAKDGGPKVMLVFSLKTLFFFIAILGLLSSCNNPFTRDMGERVVVGDARIFNISPSTASFLHGEVEISGEAWAHRELRRIDVRIPGDEFAERGIHVPGLGVWTDITAAPGFGGEITRNYVPGYGINASWRFTIDTENFKGGGIALPDGTIRIQFRAVDNVGPSEVIEVFYTVKNDPAMISLSVPRDIGQLIAGGSEIRGNVVDLMGLAPGYPMIWIRPRDTANDAYQYWPPPDGESNHGWVSMFINSPASYPAVTDSSSPPGQYDGRWWIPAGGEDREPVTINFATFAFRLNRSRPLDPFPADDPRYGIIPAVFYTAGLQAGQYSFRILTRDIVGTVGHYPPFLVECLDPTNPFCNHADCLLDHSRPALHPHWIEITDNEDPPYIAIDNRDLLADPGDPNSGWKIDPYEFPSRFITGPTSRIIANDAEGRPDRTIFRLRVRAEHSEGVHSATLRWNHPASGADVGGYLALDADRGGSDGVPHDPNNPLDRQVVYFYFTAGEEHRHIFATHSGAYTLTLSVSSFVYAPVDDDNQDGSQIDRIAAERTFNLFMDGEGPRVEIRPSIRGAVGPPGGDPDPSRPYGGFINTNPIAVNANVQVLIDRSAAFGILVDQVQEEGQPSRQQQIVKWAVQRVQNTGNDAVAQFIANPTPDSLLYYLARFRNDPTSEFRGGADEPTGAFFHRIAEIADNSGWVIAPDPGHAIEAYRTHNFKLNTSPHDGHDLWLYVIAMDGVRNIGFAMQRLRVDESTDYPDIYMPSLFDRNASGQLIDGQGRLKATVGEDDNGNPRLVSDGNWTPTSPRRNILQLRQGIEIVMSDDDGILWDSDHVEIWLTDMNVPVPGRRRIYIGNPGDPRWIVRGTERQLSWTLPQSVMAEVLGHDRRDHLGEFHLYDGFYYLEITVRDSEGHKVEIGGETGPQRYRGVSYWFAVHTEVPDVDITDPVFDSLNPALEEISITGTVRSRFRIQGLWITFADGALYDSEAEEPVLPAGTRKIILGNPVPHGHEDYRPGLHTYRWTEYGVILNPHPIGDISSPAAEQRNFTLKAFDDLGFDEVSTHRVRVDSSPPTIDLVNFNQLRPLVDGVWGNVHFRINITDTHALYVEDLIEPMSHPPPPLSQRLGVWWLLLPMDSGIPTRDTIQNWPIVPGLGGRFYFFPEFYHGTPRQSIGHTLNNVILDAVFDSSLLRSGEEYRLFVIARDDADNWSHRVLVERIRSNHYAGGWEIDYPTLVDGRLEPATPPGAETIVLGADQLGSLNIRGVARDADDFLRDREDQYVHIRFSADGISWDDDGWIRIDNAGLDPIGAVDFTFPFFARGTGFHSGVPDGLRSAHGDVTVRYQIRVTDEPSFRIVSGSAVTTLADALTTRNKNPQLGLRPRFGADFTFYPHHVPAPVGSVSRVFPVNAPSDQRTYFEFILDDTPPEIEFTARFAATPTFGNVDDLMRALQGTIREANPFSFSISLGLAEPVILVFGEYGLEQVVPGESGYYFWDLDNARPGIEAMWRDLPPGTRNVLLVSEDRAGNVGRVNWPFIKDIQGPNVSFTNIGRSIYHTYPAAGFFPVNWPLDWPHGTDWNTGPQAWPSPFINAIADWPSDFALLPVGLVVARLTAERNRIPTVITEPAIRGDFDDLHGFIFDRDEGFTPDNLATHPYFFTFYYRLNSGVGRGALPPSDVAGWEQVRVERATAGQSLSSFQWEIPLDIPDGNHTLDIKIRDNAANWTELFGVRFVLDTADPEFVDLGWDNVLGGADVPDPPAPNYFNARWSADGGFVPMLDHQRVFSAGIVGEDDHGTVFELRGRIRDANLRDLTARISSEGIDLVTAVAEAGTSGSTDTESGPLADSTSLTRLELLYVDGIEWEWTLTIYGRDIYRLRNQPGTRRLVSLAATDVANNRSDIVQWPFYLDGSGPVIEIHNLQATADSPGLPVPAGARNVLVPGTAITGGVDDLTGIRNVTFIAARWDYTAGGWRWLDESGNFTLTGQPPYGNWHSALRHLDPAGFVPASVSDSAYIRQGRADSSVNWEIPGSLFADEGQYKVLLRATDWSLARLGSVEGNPSVSGSARPGTPPASPNVPGGVAHLFFIDDTGPEFLPHDGGEYFAINWHDSAVDAFAPIPERERVFNVGAGVANSDAVVFRLRGRVRDTNLRELTATVGSEGASLPAFGTVAGSAAASSRLSLDPVDGLPDVWEWTLSILETDIYGLLNQPGDDTLRFVSLFATDVANERSDIVQWPFFLDNGGPSIEIHNLQTEAGLPGLPVPAGARNVFVPIRSGGDVTGTAITGSANDATGIRDVTFTAAWWDYALGAWNWLSADGWTAAEADRVWRSALEHAGFYNYVDDGRSDLSVNWEIPGSLFAEEGQYKILIRAADWSLDRYGAMLGNPSVSGGTRPGGTDIVPGGAAHLFFVDAGAPVLVDLGWGNVLGGVTVPDPAAPNYFNARWSGTEFRPMVEHQRVFSAGDISPTSNDMVFELQGRIRDANLRGLTARIGSERVDLVTSAAVAGEPGSTDIEGAQPSYASRLSLAEARVGGSPSGAIIPGEWVWTLSILERDIHSLLNQSGTGDGTRRFVSLVATDVANDSSNVAEWLFYLDSAGPVIEIHNLQVAVAPADPGQATPAGTRNVFIPTAAGTAITGSANDATGVRNVTFAAARWDYAAGGWRWLDTYGGFALELGHDELLPPDGYWRSALEHAGFFNYVAENRADLSVNWEIPGSLFAGEGRYKVHVRAADWSLARTGSTEGNPSVYGGFSHHFFVDSGPPVIRWVNEERQFFNTAALDSGFAFDLEDANTVTFVGAVMRNAAGNEVGSVAVDIDGLTWSNPGANVSWGTGSRRVTLMPPTAGIGQGQFTLTVTVQDSAGNQAYMGHTRTFTHDNVNPILEIQTVITRPSQNLGNPNDDINIGLAGHVTIRGTTDAGISPLPVGRVRYALLLPGQGVGDAGVQWRSENAQDGDLRWTENTNSTVEIIRMNENPSHSWTVEILNTRNIIAATDPEYEGNSPDTGAFVQPHVVGTVAAGHPNAGLPSVPGTLNWDDEALADGERVYLARLAIEATDESGNMTRRVYNLWIYPEGDRPNVAMFTPGPVQNRTRLDTLNANRLSGRFTVTGRAWDNEFVDSVFFRALRVENVNVDTGGLGTPFTHTDILIHEVDFVDGEWITLATPQTARWINLNNGTVWPLNSPNPPAGLGYTHGWFQAGGGQRRDGGWNATLNACGRLNYEGAAGERAIAIEVVALDAARDPEGDWTATGAFFSNRTNTSRTYVYVVSGAPEFGDIVLELTGVMDENREGSPEEFHIGRRVTAATLEFDVTVPAGREISAIRFQATDPGNLAVGTGPMHDLIDRTPGSTMGNGINLDAIGTGITGITVDGTRTDTTRRVTVTLNPGQLADAFPGSSGRFPLHVIASDNSSPPLTARAVNLYVHVDDSAPFARMEFNPSIAGMAASLGGSAAPWSSGVEREDVGRVDRVIVWFERIRGADGAERRISWNGTVPVATTTPFRGEWVYVSNAAAWADWNQGASAPNAEGNPGRIQLPSVPAYSATEGGDFAIVIDRNDPMNSVTAYGQRLVTGWTLGGLGQQWRFTFDSTQLPSGPLDMHFVVFDRAGNATWATQRIVVMNDAPMIRDVQIATDIRGGNALNNRLNAQIDDASGTNSFAVGGDGIFSQITHLIDNADIDFGSPLPNDVERNIRRGISPVRRPPTQAGVLGFGSVQNAEAHQGVAGQGARYRFSDFTTRNNFLAFGIQTLQPPGAEIPGRSFRVEHVYLDSELIDAEYIEAGGAYMVVTSTPTMDWSAVGAQQRIGSTDNFVFVAIADGETLPEETRTVGQVRRFNPVAGTILTHPFGDAAGTTPMQNRSDAVRAEFAFRGTDANGGFGTGANQIEDYNHANADAVWHDRYALFLVSVFDGPQEDRFGDFTLLSVRVNNNDQTRPFAQLYDLNPAAIGHNFAAAGANPDAPATAVETVIRPTTIDGNQNRTMGGLWRHNRYGNLSRPGNIEPRMIEPSTGIADLHPNYAAHWHSLTPTQMGAVAGERETVNREAFFDYDTVSGRVILRGYAEDDQRINEVRLFFTEVDNGLSENFAILESPATLGSQTTSPVPQTGLLAVPATGPATGNVFFTDTIDLYRHRVEWAFVWDTANVPANFVAGNLTVRVQASNYVPSAENLVSETIDADDEETMGGERAGAVLRTDPRMRNFGFPAGMYVYNQIRINVRPYITGFVRETAFNNTRSLQGRRAFFRGGVSGQADEIAVVTGFNLGFAAAGFAGSATNIVLPGPNTGVATAVVDNPGTFGLSGSPLPVRFRRFTVPSDARTDDGIVTLNVVLPTDRSGADAAARTFHAVNTGTERPSDAGWRSGVTDETGQMNGDWWVQPWNVERSAAGGEGSHLWDNVTRVHIWQSNDATSGANQGSFPATRTGWEGSLFGTSMAIDPGTGTLWASHNEAGGATVLLENNTGMTVRSTNEGSRDIRNRPGGAGTTANQRIEAATDQAGDDFRVVTGWADPVVNSSIAVDASGTAWVVSSLIGITGGAVATDPLGGRSFWRHLGGLWVHGPGGDRMNFEPIHPDHPPPPSTSFPLYSTPHAGTGTPDGAALAGSWPNDSLHHVESGWFNGAEQGPVNAGWAGPWAPATGNHGQLDQFRNPRIVTFTYGGVTHTHVAYFDSKDGSIKYRFIRHDPNRIGGPMTTEERLMHGIWGWQPDYGSAPLGITEGDVLRGWVNLDGGFDADDTVALPSVFPFTDAVADFQVASTGIPENARVVNHTVRDGVSHPNNTGAPRSRTRGSIIAGEHNDIAVTSQGFPVIAYFDTTNQRLRLAVSNSRTPFSAYRWSIVTDVLAGDPRSFGTGQYVSMKIDTVDNADIVHISAWNSAENSLVYIRGRVDTGAVSSTNDTTTVNPAGLWTLEEAVFVDSIGSVGRRSTISLDSRGNPWIAYLDGSLVGGREGVKVAFLDRDAAVNRHEFGRRQYDLFGGLMTGWETMHVPARFAVVDHQDFVQASQLGMENFPTRNGPQFTAETIPDYRWWRGAVGFLSDTLFRIAYWVE